MTAGPKKVTNKGGGGGMLFVFALPKPRSRILNGPASRYGYRASGVTAGPLSTLPSGAKCEP